MNAPAPIRPLADHVINQIAAGEVIERPASIVKELLENSVDAGATRIEIDIDGGGIDSITIDDDGCGIRAEDISAALTRHCTSKLRDATELVNVRSLGFRGEALASIAAVAELELVTRLFDAEHAWRASSQPGQPLGTPQPAAGKPGTRVVVRKLFATVPARRRFLKQPRTEGLHVQRVVRQLVFACPALALEFTHGGARALRFPPAEVGTPSQRWRSLFGTRFLEQASMVDEEADGLRVTGWVGDPAVAGTQSDLQYLTINGRVVRDRNLQHAVRAAFGDSLLPGTYPGYALALQMPAEEVDVNVHPGKLEVRFSDLRRVHDIVLLAVRHALGAVPAPARPLGVHGERAMPPQVADRGETYRPQARPAETTAPAKAKSPSALPGRLLSLVADRYLLIALDDRTGVLDLRAVWRRTLEVRLASERHAGSRKLLIPVRLDGSTGRALMADERLRDLGFEFDDLGPAGVIVRAVPAVLPAHDEARVLQSLGEVEGLDDPASTVARMVAEAIELGVGGTPRRAVVEELERAVTAAGLSLENRVRELDGTALEALFDAR